MQGRSNREFKELLEKIYEQRFDSKNYTKKIMEEIKTIPYFLYNDETNNLKIELKEDEIVNNNSIDLDKFYNNLQNIERNTSKELIINIKCDDDIYKKVLNKYIDIIHFENKPNTKYYTKKYFKEKILVELAALDSILNYAILNNLEIKINSNNVDITGQNLNLNFELQLIDEHYYLTLKQNINRFDYIIYTSNYIYICYDGKIYRCNKQFIENEYIVLKTFLNNYKNSIHIYKKNLTNFFSLIYPKIKENTKISEQVYENVKKYIPQNLNIKLFHLQTIRPISLQILDGVFQYRI